MKLNSSLESGKPIGLFSPHQLLVNALCTIPTIHIYRQEGLLIWSHNNEPVKQFSYLHESKAATQLDFILGRLRSSESIFVRHFENLTNLESSYREIAMTILAISQDLAGREISTVVFPTMSSHHLDSLMMEIACQVNEIPQVFQYIPVVANRCLPIIQYKGIHDRKLMKLIDIKRANNFWQSNISAEDWRAPHVGSNHVSRSNFYASFFTICAYDFRTKFRKFRENCKQNPLKLLQAYIFHTSHIKQLRYSVKSNLKPISLWQDIKLMRIHKKSLEHLNSLIIEDADYTKSLLENNSTSIRPLIAIAANFQPEATSFPEAGKIYNFIDLVILMRSKGITAPILYKEHPAVRFFVIGHRSTRCGVARSANYYSTLKSLGVYFLDSHFDLTTSESLVPLTLNGSIAIERSLMGLPTILTGSPWFAGIPGTISLNEFISSPMKYSLNKSQKKGELATNFIDDIMESSIAIEPILYGIQISNESQIQNFLEEYKHFLEIVQRTSLLG